MQRKDFEKSKSLIKRKNDGIIENLDYNGCYLCPG